MMTVVITSINTRTKTTLDPGIETTGIVIVIVIVIETEIETIVHRNCTE
jgi:hypothetical protein